MATAPVQHHLLPKFYLAGFTPSGCADDFLFVFDYKRSRTYRAKPGKVARRRDFYRNPDPDDDPNSIEKTFAEIEDDFAPRLKQMLADKPLLKRGRDRGALLYFVAMLYARGEHVRARLAQAITFTMTTKLASNVVSRQEWEGFVAAEARTGVDVSNWPTYEQTAEWVRSGRWRPEPPQLLQVHGIGIALAAACDALRPLDWSFAVANPARGGFISSDTPLTWARQDAGGAWLEQIPMDDPRAVFTVPLSKEVALVGRSNGALGVFAADDATVAAINRNTLVFSMGTLYASHDDFPLLYRDGDVRSSREYFAYVRRARSDGITNP